MIPPGDEPPPYGRVGRGLVPRRRACTAHGYLNGRVAENLISVGEAPHTRGMLTTLRISGLAIVDQAEVAFGPGLNVLTGETGAGKSILVQALHLVLGGRMAADALREGAEEAVVEALFDLPARHPVLERLLAAGLPVAVEGGEVLVRRSAARGGRGRAFVNGALCTVGMLESCARGLVDLTGQHEHVALLDEASHVALLDAFAGVDGEGGLLTRYRAAHAVLASALRRRAELARAREERARRADWLTFQLGELDALRPAAGEDRALERERQLLASAERLRGAARGAEAAIYGEEHLLRLRLIQLLSRQHVPLVEMHARLLHLSLHEIRALLKEEEAQTALLEQAAQAPPSQEYVAKLLRNAREARQASPAAPRSVAPHPDQLRDLPAPDRRHGKNIQEELPTSRGVWQRWELAPGIEIHIRTESEHQHRSLLARLFQAAGKHYPPSDNQ